MTYAEVKAKKEKDKAKEKASSTNSSPKVSVSYAEKKREKQYRAERQAAGDKLTTYEVGKRSDENAEPYTGKVTKAAPAETRVSPVIEKGQQEKVERVLTQRQLGGGAMSAPAKSYTGDDGAARRYVKLGGDAVGKDAAARAASGIVAEDAIKHMGLIADKTAKEDAERDALLSYDLEEGAKRIEELEARVKQGESTLDVNYAAQNESDAAFATGEKGNTARANDASARQAFLEERNASRLRGEEHVATEALLSDEKALEDERAYYKKAEEYQKLYALAHDALDAEDFEEYSNKGASYGEKSEKWWLGIENDVAYKRNTPGVLEDYESAANSAGDSNGGYVTAVLTADPEYLAAKYMTDEQFAIYNYYFGKDKENGTAIADQYLQSILPELTKQAAAEKAAGYNNKWYESVYNLNASVLKGTTDLTQGAWNMITRSEDTIQYSPSVVASQMAMGDNTGVWKVVNDLASTTGNMLPSIGASVIANMIVPGSGAVIGSALMGTSAAGGAYDEMIQLGYSAEQARTYGVLVGASEAALQYALGGIGALGGGLTDDAVKALAPSINNALANFAKAWPSLQLIGHIGKEMTKEAAEEALQTALEPIIKAYATGEAYEAAQVEEILYSALLGALSSLALEGAPTAVKNAPALVLDAGRAADKVIGGIVNRGKGQLTTENGGDNAPAFTPAQTAQMDADFGAAAPIVNGIDDATLTDGMSESAVDALKEGVSIVGEAEAGEWALDFREAYTAGKEGFEMPDGADSASMMTDGQREAAYEMGVNDAKAAKSQAVENPKTDAKAKPTQANAEADVDADLLSDKDISSDIADMLEFEKATSVRIAEVMPGITATFGKDVSSAEAADRKTKAARAKTITARTGYLAGANETDIRAAEFLSKVFGRTIIFDSSDYTINGKLADGVVHVNPKSGDAPVITVMHELMHSVENTKSYAPLLKMLKQYSAAKHGEGHWDTLVAANYDKYQKAYKSQTGESYTDAKAEFDVAARMMAEFFGIKGRGLTMNQADVTQFAIENRTAASRMWYTLKRAAVRIREDIAELNKRVMLGKEYSEADAKMREAQLMLRHIENMRDKFGTALREARRSASKGNGGFSFAESQTNKKISVDTTDAERTEILKNKAIAAPIYEGQAEAKIAENYDDLKSQSIPLIKAALLKIGKDFDVLKHDIYIKDVEIVTQVSKGTLKESASKDIDPIRISKLIPILKEAIENSIGIECHKNRYYFDDNTVYFENLFGGYIEDNSFVPVRLGLKHNKLGKATLYVVIDQEVIDMRKIGATDTSSTKKDQGHQSIAPIDRTATPRLVNISIAQIVPFVNSKDIIEYFPDGLLSPRQIEMKQEEAADTVRKTDAKNDKKYSEFVASGKKDAAFLMLKNKSADKGYASDSRTDSTVYREATNSVKSTEITYDDEGLLIPFSKRYDDTNPDTRFSFSDNTGSRAITRAEAENRIIAIRMLEAGESAEAVYEKTGWYRDPDYGSLLVDHEAPVYIGEKNAYEKARHAADIANKRADIAEADSAKVRGELATLREDAAKWQARAERAERNAKLIEKSAEWRIKADRELSPEYVPSQKQVRGIVEEICSSLGGEYTSSQKRAFTERLLDIYDRMGRTPGAQLTDFSLEIAELIGDMQDVRINLEENAEIARTLKAELKTPVFLSEKARGDLKDGYGATARMQRGKVNLVSKAKGTPVDVRYMELSEAYPEWFSPEIVNEADQLRRMIEVSDVIRDRDFASRDRYDGIGADPEAVRTDDFSKAMVRIVNGFGELEAVPRTFADELMRQAEYDSREHQRELARATAEVRERLEREHAAKEERLMREAEAAMEWETEHLSRELSSVYAQMRSYIVVDLNPSAAAEARSKAEAKERRDRECGRYISDAAIEASRADGSFTSIMTELYDRYNALEDEIARVQAEVRRHDHVDVDTLQNKGEKAYIKDLRARRDELLEKKSNLNAYINKVNARVKEIRFKTICDMIAKDGYFKDWKDKNMPLAYAIETMRRNVKDIAPKNRDSALAEYMIKEIFDPVTAATYASTLVMNEARGRVKDLKLSLKVNKGDVLSESQFVQAYAEAKDNISALESGEGAFLYNKFGERMREGMTLEEWQGYLNRIIKENPGITKDAATMERVNNAVEVFSDIYDKLFVLVNNARVRNGYAPVPYRRGYFPHYNNDTKQDGIMASLFKAMGWAQEEISEKIPTSINGLTSTFKPGIRYMSNAKQRSLAGFEGERVITGAVEGLDRYLEVAVDVAFQTDNIQNLRALANAIRYSTTSDSTKEQVDKIRADNSLSYDEKQAQINGIFASRDQNTKYALNHFVPELEEYTNLLAGKKSKRDRSFEDTFGRNFYTFMKRVTSTVSANMIFGNIGSVLTNYIPLMDGGATMHYHMLGAAWDMAKNIISDDGFVATSQFLTNRRGSERLVRSTKDKAATLSYPSFVDDFTSELLVRARVRQNMTKHRGSMDYAHAMEEADNFIAGMMADRSKGGMPTIYGTSNPLIKAFAMYQVEVKNQFSFMFKDLKKDSGALEWVAKLMMMALLHRFFNDTFEKIVGRRPAFDPLELLNDLHGDLTGKKFESFYGIFDGDGNITVDTKKKKVADAALNLGKGALEQTPFIGGVLGGGRVPISSALPDGEALASAFKSWEANGFNRDVAESLYKGVSPVIYYGAFPMMGGQAKKAIEGVNALVKGGSYSYNSAGEKQLQYPMYTDEGAKSILSGAKTVLFGKSGTEGGQAWVENEFNTLSPKKTAAYESLVASGVSQRDAYAAVSATSEDIYNAVVSGDGAFLANVEVALGGEKEYEKALRKCITEFDPRIIEAAEASARGDVATRTALAKEIVGEGKFDQDIVVAAINNKATSIKSASKTEEAESEEGAEPDVPSYYSTADVSAAFDAGDDALALEVVEDLIRVKIESGNTKKEAQASVRSSVTRAIKQMYLDAYYNGNTAERKRIAEFLKSTGLYSNVSSTLSDWVKADK